MVWFSICGVAMLDVHMKRRVWLEVLRESKFGIRPVDFLFH